MFFRKTLRDYLKQLITFGVVAVFIVYGLLKITPFLMGPSIRVDSPRESDVLNEPTFIVRGQVKRANEVLLQGKPITISPTGDFQERLVSYSPYTILTIEAKDKYGKVASFTLLLPYTISSTTTSI